MAKCKTCGAPVNLAPDGDPKYEIPYNVKSLESSLEAVKVRESRYFDLLIQAARALCVSTIDSVPSAAKAIYERTFGSNNWVHIHSVFTLPEAGKPVFALIENDCYEDPFVLQVVAVSSKTHPNLIWKLINFNPNIHEEILQQCYTVIAWRYIKE